MELFGGVNFKSLYKNAKEKKEKKDKHSIILDVVFDSFICFLITEYLWHFEMDMKLIGVTYMKLGDCMMVVNDDWWVHLWCAHHFYS